MNFRAAYLTSLGFQHERIAKSEIGSFFSGDVIAVSQLQRLCLRVGVGATWRGMAWKVLLGVLPPQRAAWALAAEMGEETYLELDGAATVFIDRESGREEKILGAYALHAVLLHRGGASKGAPSMRTVRAFLQSEEAARARSVIRIMCRVFVADWEAFWCAVRFIKAQRIVAVLKNTGHELQSWGVSYRVRLLAELLHVKEPGIAKLLRDVGVREEDFAARWMRTCFADALREDDVLALWDRVIAAPADFVSHFSLECLIVVQPQIQALRGDRRAVLQLLSNLPPLKDFARCMEQAASATVSLLDEARKLDPLLTFDVEWPTVHYGDRGVLVRVVQLLLRSRGLGGMFSVDSVFGDRTVSAIQEWQAQMSLRSRERLGQRNRQDAEADPIGEFDESDADREDGAPDGTPDYRPAAERAGWARRVATSSHEDVTFSSSLETLEDASPPTERFDERYQPNPNGPGADSAAQAATKPVDDARTIDAMLWPKLIQSVSAGNRGDAVRALQALLLHKHGYFRVREDGYFGAQTVSAVKDFQANVAARAMPVDGIVGPVTWIHLVNRR